MKTTKNHFGKVVDHIINAYTLENDHRMKVTVLDYGATLQSILIPRQNGEMEIVCGFNSMDSYFSKEYTENAPYFGGTVGRYTSQMKNGEFTLNGKKYALAKNCGENNLHGGFVGFDKQFWKADFKDTKNGVALQMCLKSEHMQEGFPGKVYVQVTFSLNNENTLAIDYAAQSDHDTPFSITNHAYFNLNGFEKSVEEHTVRINSDKRLEWDASGAANGTILQVAGTTEDLRTQKSIGEVHQAMQDGFEHYYLFDEGISPLKKVGEIKSDRTGVTMAVSTTEPGMLFYTGKYTSDALKRESGLQYGKYRGFCCETHRWPNGPNLPNSPKSVLKANENFASTTSFKFSW
ncbi:aldose 1-epimerase [Flavobacteriaceae bacterium MAR_2009_75]|nr:aldose 1-epimerase [Flavobacteriaceae bacterium MAR_2009_75]